MPVRALGVACVAALARPLERTLVYPLAGTTERYGLAPAGSSPVEALRLPMGCARDNASLALDRVRLLLQGDPLQRGHLFV